MPTTRVARGWLARPHSGLGHLLRRGVARLVLVHFLGRAPSHAHLVHQGPLTSLVELVQQLLARCATRAGIGAANASGA